MNIETAGVAAHDRYVDAAVVLLVDARGCILLQQRASQPPRAPVPYWSFVGGGIEEGETPEQAARREVGEETGLTIIQPLTLFLRFPRCVRGHHLVWYVFSAATGAREEDVIIGEGLAVRFIPAAEIPHLTLHPAATTILAAFLVSPLYAHLTETAERW